MFVIEEGVDTMIQKEYIEKTYAGWLGKVIGIRMGAPIEGWTREKIAMIYGNQMKDYVVDYKDFAADDDSNGPIFFVRGLEHYKELTAREMGYTCLNYIPKEHGFFWWGNELSTEHTAYKNLIAGIEAPRSGSAELNGMEMAEQIGGQIFIDGFGFVAPGNPNLACELAEASAKVTHEFDGVAGARFIAACIALAYDMNDIHAIIKEALRYISPDGNYYKVVQEMLTCYESGVSSDEAFQVLRAKYWTDKYEGICHIIPNAGIIAIALLYGEGNFLDSMELVNLLGFDTDCNAGNLGAILGVMCGTYQKDPKNGIPKHLITPIQDIMLASSIVGSLNISTLSENTLLFCKLGYELAGEPMPEPFLGYVNALEKEGKRIAHFEFTDAIHGFRIKGSYKNAELRILNSEEDAFVGNRSLKVTMNNLHPGNQVFVYQNTYYEPADLHDARYQPCFSPIVYPGDKVHCYVKNVTGQKLMAYLYCYDTANQEYHRFTSVDLSKQEEKNWVRIEGQIPTLINARVKEIGIEIVSNEVEDTYFGEQVLLYLDHFVIQSNPSFLLNMGTLEFDDYTLHGVKQKELSGFTHYQGNIEGIKIEEEGLLLSKEEKIFTGDYYWRDYESKLIFRLKQDMKFDMLVRAQGSLRAYAVRVTTKEIQILKYKEMKETILTSMPLVMQIEEEYLLSVKVMGDTIQAQIEDVTLEAHDAEYEYGMIGVQVDQDSVVLLKEVIVKSAS